MREVISLAWERLNVISSVIGDVQGRVIATLFYFTILLPFGVGSRSLSDPLNIRPAVKSSDWLAREPQATDIDSAKLQG